jgi:hypothetical protein
VWRVLGEEGEYGTLGEPLLAEREKAEATRASLISRHSEAVAARFVAREARRRASRFANAPLRVVDGIEPGNALWEGGGSFRAGGIKPGRVVAFVRLIHWMSRTNTAMRKMHSLRKMNQMHKMLMAISTAR